MATIDPVELLQQQGETFTNWQARVCDLAYRAGTGVSGPNVAMARQALAFVTSPTVPSAWSIR